MRQKYSDVYVEIEMCGEILHRNNKNKEEKKMRHTSCVSKIIVIVLSLSFLVAFVSSSEAQNVIKIGVSGGFTGTYASVAKHQKMGIDMAVAEINERGGVLGRKVEVIYEDDQNSPALCYTKVEKMILQDGVDFIIPPANSAATLNIMNLVEKHHKVMMVGLSSSDKITTDSCNKYTFRVIDNSIIEANALVAWVMKKVGKKVYFLTVDNAWGTSTSEMYGKVAKGMGGTILGESLFPLNTKDFAPYFGKIKAAKPEVLVVTCAGNDAISVVTQLQEYGLRKLMKVVGPGSFVAGDVLPAMGSNADEIISTSHYADIIATAANKAFVDKFQKIYKEIPSKYAESNYDAVVWLAQAVERAKSLNSDAVIKALEGSVYVGPQGTKKMRAGDHQAIIDMYILKCEGGKYVLIDSMKGDDVIHPNLCNKW